MSLQLKNAAIILLCMGENLAAEVLKILDQQDVEAIVEMMNNMEHVSEEDVIKALNVFFNEARHTSGLNMISGDYIKNALISAVGSDKAGSLMEKDTLMQSLKGIELLKWQPIHAIVNVLKDEHPQIITVALICLDSTKAAKILSELPKETAKTVIKRMSQLSPLSQFAMEILSEYLEAQFTQATTFKLLHDDVVNAAADIISKLDAATEHEIVSFLHEDNVALGEKIQEKLFPFEKLGQLDNRSLQTLLKEIEQDVLSVALKGADDHIKKIFFKAMSAKSAELLQEDMDSLGPVKINDVIEAQKKMVQKAKELASDDKIAMPSAKKTIIV